MIDRRTFFAAALAAGATGLTRPAFAHTKSEPYELPEEFLPREVRLKTELAPGEIHVDPQLFALYWTLPDNRAIRYTVGVGRGNLYHDGVFTVLRKKKWPGWKPTPAMMKREPNAYKNFRPGGKYENGQPGGLNNPLGAMALYLYDDRGRDTYLRIHGTNQPRTIGTAVSNGCARLINAHALDLYERVPLNTRVVLYPKTEPTGLA